MAPTAAAAAASGGKRKRRSSETKGGTGKSDRVLLPGLSEEAKNLILKNAQQEAKESFEDERDDILSQLSPKVRKLFGQIGFAKFGKAWYGALVLNPYDVPPGAVRNKWLDMFEKVSWMVACTSDSISLCSAPGPT